jgi:hypothetical protein
VNALRALGLNLLAATCVVGLAVFLPSPAKPQPSGLSLGFGLNGVALVKEAGYRRHRDVRSHLRYRYTNRSYSRPSYRYFGDDPGRYFGVGPGAYECYGYDCNW